MPRGCIDMAGIAGVRRLTRIHARSVEQIIDIDSDEIFNWPWLYAVGIGDWKLNASQAERRLENLGASRSRANQIC